MNTARRVAALAIATAMALGGVALSTPASAEGTDTSIVDCAGRLVQKPSSITITCADGGVSINKITWSTWTANSARGTGTLAWNTCLPKTCVDGIVETYRVRITMGRVASAPNEAVFTQATLRFPKGGPAGLETGSYTIDNPIG